MEQDQELKQKVESQPKELSSIPQTRNLMAFKYMKLSNKYKGKNRKQNFNKLNNILNRELRLKKYGWSLLMFK